LLAERWVPASVYKRRKVIFRAPLDSFHMDPEPKFVGQLLSEESLRRTGYFDAAAVHHWRRAFRQMPEGSLPRLSVEGGLAAWWLRSFGTISILTRIWLNCPSVSVQLF
jgi:asparagine synthase (glutamine-hydrolysing)